MLSKFPENELLVERPGIWPQGGWAKVLDNRVCHALVVEEIFRRLDQFLSLITEEWRQQREDERPLQYFQKPINLTRGDPGDGCQRILVQLAAIMQGQPGYHLVEGKNRLVLQEQLDVPGDIGLINTEQVSPLLYLIVHSDKPGHAAKTDKFVEVLPVRLRLVYSHNLANDRYSCPRRIGRHEPLGKRQRKNHALQLTPGERLLEMRLDLQR